MTDHPRQMPSEDERAPWRVYLEPREEFEARHPEPESEVRPGIRGKRSGVLTPREQMICDFLERQAAMPDPHWDLAAQAVVAMCRELYFPGDPPAGREAVSPAEEEQYRRFGAGPDIADPEIMKDARR